MVSIGNRSKLVSPEICQQCGKCCKEFTISENIDMALRFMWMADSRFSAEDTPFLFFDGVAEKSVRVKIPCKQLRKVGSKYLCAVHDKERPDFCCTYPDHIFRGVELWNKEKIQKLLDFEKEHCPGLANLTPEQVIKKLQG